MNALIESFGWPPYWEEDVRESPRILARITDSVPCFPSFEVTRIIYRRFELILREFVVKRYSDGDASVRFQYQIVLNQNLRAHTPAFKTLIQLSRSSNLTSSEWGAKADEVMNCNYPELSRRAKINRVKLFYENLEVRLEGRCGVARGFESHPRFGVPYFAYARDEESMQNILDAVHECTDEYKKIQND